MTQTQYLIVCNTKGENEQDPVGRARHQGNVRGSEHQAEEGEAQADGGEGGAGNRRKFAPGR